MAVAYEEYSHATNATMQRLVFLRIGLNTQIECESCILIWMNLRLSNIHTPMQCFFFFLHCSKQTSWMQKPDRIFMQIFVQKFCVLYIQCNSATFSLRIGPNGQITCKSLTKSSCTFVWLLIAIIMLIQIKCVFSDQCEHSHAENAAYL